MERMDTLPRQVKRVACIAAFLAACYASFAKASPNAEAEDIAAPLPAPTNMLRSGIVIRAAAVRGRVFMAAESRNEDETPAEKVRVELREKDSDKVLAKALTDEQGYFDLPEQTPDAYRLLVGGLTIPLIVEPVPPKENDLPKVIIFVLPRKMAQTAPR